MEVSPERLDPRIASALAQMAGGGAVTYVERGHSIGPAPAVILVLPLPRHLWKGAAIGHGHIEVVPYDPEGPLVRFTYQVFAQVGAAPWTLDSYLNPGDPLVRADITIMAASLAGRTLYVHGYRPAEDGGAVEYLGTKRHTWTVAERLGCGQALGLTKGAATQWPAARDRYVREHPRITLGE